MHHYTIITGFEEKHAPPSESVLKVALVGNAAFLTIGTHEESAREVKFTEQAHITVPTDTLLNTLFTALQSELHDSKDRQEGLK